MSDRRIAGIYESKDYDKFKMLDANRKLGHVQKIIDSIKSVGVLWVPILVNEKFEIIDGQHRFAACKALRLPIYYIIQPGLGIKHVMCLNENAKIWALSDYAHGYAVGDEKKDSYVHLETVKKQFPEFDYRTIVRASSDYTLSDSNYNTKIKSGEFSSMSFDQMNAAIRRLTALRGFENIISCIRSKTNLRYGILFCIYLSEVDASFNINQLHESMRNRIKTFESIRSMTDAIYALDSMYNYGRMAKNRYDILQAYENCLKKANPRTFRRIRK